MILGKCDKCGIIANIDDSFAKYITVKATPEIPNDDMPYETWHPKQFCMACYEKIQWQLW